MADDAEMSSDIRELSEGGDAVPRLSPSSTISVDSDDVMEVNITKPTPSTVKRPRRKIVIDYDCVNPECRVTGRGPVANRSRVETASSWTASYFGADVKEAKKRKVCRDCGSRALDAQTRMLEDLMLGKPVVDHDLPKKKEMVILGDSDEEAVTDTSSEESDQMEVDSEDSVDGETAESIVNAVLEEIGLAGQIEASVKNLKDRVEVLEAEAKEVDKEYDDLERGLDDLRMSLYAPFRPDLKPQEPLDIAEEVPSPVKMPQPAPSPRLAAALANNISRHQQGSSASPQQHTTATAAPNRVPIITAPPDLPEPGKLDRPPLKKGDEVFAIQGADMLAEWNKGTVLEEVQQGQDTNYKIRIPRYNASGICITAHHKTAGTRSIAYPDPAPVRLQVGTRVIGLYKEPETPRDAGGYYSGIVAEPPKGMNKYRYLVFFDDGYASYIPHGDIRVVVKQTENYVWNDIHPNSRDFIKKYLMQYPERPMVRLQAGQVVQTEWEGAWWYTKVEEVDASLVKLKFHVNHRRECIYRGSTRLLPLYNEMQQQKKRLEGKASFSRHNRGIAGNRPGVEYTRLMSDNFNDPNGPKRAVARKSTSGAANRLGGVGGGAASSPQQPQIRWEHRGTTKDAKLENVVEGVPFVKHGCGVNCLKDPKYDYVEAAMRGTNPLLIPIKLGWKREFVMFNNRGRRRIYYIAPCGRRLRSFEEVHRYLRVTHSKLEIDFFNFDFFVNVFKQWKPDRTFVEVEDMSYGRENVPVSCVNSLDNNYSEYIEYSTKRLPQKDVFINLDDGFLTCCDCVDDCQDKEKCACWQLTIQHTNATSENKIDTNVGYEYRRLKTPVQTGIFECNKLCKCKSTCLNRVAQHPLRLNLQVFKTEKRGWGIRTLHDIPGGAFICVYVGNLYTNEEGNKQGVAAGDEYFAELDMIETIERAKEGYESDVENSDDDPDDIQVIGEEENTNKAAAVMAAADTASSADSASVAGDEDGKDDEDFDEAEAEAEAARDPEDPEFTGVAPLGDETDRCTRSRQKILDKVSKKSKPAAATASDQMPATPQREVRGFNANVKAPPPKMKVSSPSKKPKFTSTRKLYSKDEDVYIMDAKCIGNIGRYLNHSCRPNVQVQNCFVDTHDVRFPWIAFFSKWKITAGEELSWDYNYIVDQVAGKEIYCECGAENCRGRLL